MLNPEIVEKVHEVVEIIRETPYSWVKLEDMYREAMCNLLDPHSYLEGACHYVRLDLIFKRTVPRDITDIKYAVMTHMRHTYHPTYEWFIALVDAYEKVFNR